MKPPLLYIQQVQRREGETRGRDADSTFPALNSHWYGSPHRRLCSVSSPPSTKKMQPPSTSQERAPLRSLSISSSSWRFLRRANRGLRKGERIDDGSWTQYVAISRYPDLVKSISVLRVVSVTD